MLDLLLAGTKCYVWFLSQQQPIDSQGSFFVTRAKDNIRFNRMYSNPIDKSTGVLCDQLGKLEGYNSLGHATEN